jgi:hypothetical protein
VRGKKYGGYGNKLRLSRRWRGNHIRVRRCDGDALSAMTGPVLQLNESERWHGGCTVTHTVKMFWGTIACVLAPAAPL